ncbi:hypothetical protein B5S33_g4127 [[Candida] boidinii]|nr:hypothetical protein B5S33_g4127 [[Candida] boidinii]
MLNEINKKQQQIPTDENIHPSNLRHLKSKTLPDSIQNSDIQQQPMQQQQQQQILQQPIQYQQQLHDNDHHIQYPNQQIINASSEQHYFLQQSTQRSRSALTNLNIDNNSIPQPTIQNNSKLQSRNIRQQQQQQQNHQNIIPDTQIDQPRILNRRKSDVLIRPDTKENEEINNKDNRQQDQKDQQEIHINDTRDSSNEALASSSSSSASSSTSSSNDEEIIRGDQRRISLKRQATESSTDLLAQTNKQELKKQRIDWDDLDADDYDDPLMVSEYVVEIFEYLHELELKTLPDPNYLHWQRNLRPRMRSILVDWMVEVHLKFRLLPETLFLAINIMDRFMSKESVQVDRLQLLATGSLFIAAKYEEVYSPSVKNYAYVTDGGFTEEEILNAENFILEILNFNMSYPNPMNFLRRISKADDYDVQSRTIGKYLLEISIIDHKFIGFLPSLCAAASMYISRKMLGKFEWSPNLIHYSGGYKESDMKEVCEMIMEYLVSPIVHEEFFKKYASRKFMKVSMLARQWARKLIAEGKSIMDPEL